MMTPFTHPLTGDTIYRTAHPSGLDILVWPQEHACAAYATFATRYGSVNNSLPTADGGTEEVPAGIAHFLEHKLFESEEGDAFTRYAATGASANAYTSFNRTAYLFHATDNILPALEILLDFVQHPYFTEETVQKEQGIIGQEIRMGEDEPSQRVLYNMLGGMYHKHPVRIDIAGTVESISHITADLLYRCYNQYYNLHNMVLVVAGKITPHQVEQLADRLLIPAPPQTPFTAATDEPDAVAEQYVEAVMPVAAPLFDLGFKEPSDAARNATALAAAEMLPLLIAGEGSDLYADLMQKGLINSSFSAEYFNGVDYGVWLFEGESADPRQVECAITDEIRRLQREGIDAARVEQVRRAAYGQIIKKTDDPSECAEFLMAHILDGLQPLELLDAIAAITAEELTQQLRCRISVDNRTLSVIKPQ